MDPRSEDKLDKLVADLHGFRTETVAELRVQREQLAEHMRRTDLLEQTQFALAKEVRPLTRAHYMWSGVGKFLAVVATLVGALEAVLAASKHLH